ncbi:MAG: alpha/beta fold hydrolase [Rhodothalassiaceae bacterium]
MPSVQMLTRSGLPSLAYVHHAGQGPGWVFLGGFRSDMTGTKALALERWARAAGRAFTRFDYSGHGQSDGRFEDGTISQWRDDVLAIIDQVTEGPLILIGSSMGGWIALLCALARPQRVAGLVGIAAAPDFTEKLMWHRYSDAVKQQILDTGRHEEPSVYSDEPTVITKALIEDGRQHLLLGNPIDLDLPVRLIHGQRDEDVPWQMSLDLARAIRGEDVTVTLVKAGDHRLSTPADLTRLRTMIDPLAAPS